MLYIPGLPDLGILGLPLTRVAFLAQLLLLLRSHNALLIIDVKIYTACMY
jgi:hypothetical protein